MTTVETAWLAGLFEGEGSLTMKPHRGCELRIKMTDKDVIDRVLATVGVGKVVPIKKERDHHKQAWEWRLSKRIHTYPLLVKLLPFMGERRALKFLNQLDKYDYCY